MIKYSPSVKNNNELKEKLISELKQLLYKMEKKQYNNDLGISNIEGLVGLLKSDLEIFINAIGTGKEDIGKISEDTSKQIKEVSKLLQQAIFTRLETNYDSLSFLIGTYKDILNGDIDYYEFSSNPEAKISWGRKRLNNKLEELLSIKTEFQVNERRLEKEILDLEKELNEFEDNILAEDNERKINDIYRKISAVQSKLEVLNSRKTNYSVCFNLLDMIFTSASEILKSSEYAADEIIKAKSLLNIAKLKTIMVDPSRAIATLKIIEKDINEITSRVKSIDEKVFKMNSNNTVINQTALEYKEKLMRKRLEKSDLESNKSELEKEVKNNEIKIEGEK